MADQLGEQWRKWERDLKGAAQGNPFATLCQTCCGRHSPPRDELCPRPTLSRSGGQTNR